MHIPFAFIYTKSAPWGASEGLLLGCTQGGAILLNRYEAGVGKPYLDLLCILEGRDYFVLTTNVDHQFQLAGFDKARLFYTQGDYGLFQCSRNCFGETYDNERQVREMAELQKDQRVPSELVPRCPRCGAPMVPNLRIDGSFCEDRGWHDAVARYRAFCEAHSGDRILYLELGVGGQHTRHHQIPLLEGRGTKRPRGVRLREHRRGVRTGRNRWQEYPRR